MAQQEKSVRVRFAPSPTGTLHVGGLRTCFFNWLFARHHQGTLVVRIEDTDQQRSRPEYERLILEDLRLFGVGYDEGPGCGGPHAPYRQSERLSIYAKYVEFLRNAGTIYPCFCPEELLTQKREAALKLGRIPHYDGTCAQLSEEDRAARFARGERAGWRFRALARDIRLHDEVRGEIEFRAGMVGDFFITRTPAENEREMVAGVGMPVYNFCCVIDDHLMGITHVIRGEEHLSNTIRQLMLYEAFGWELPKFAHTPMVLGADRQKLSKRSSDVGSREYLEKGYLPEVMLNFIVLLGWWPPKDFKTVSGHPEILSREELVSCFGLDGVQKAPAIFDVQKLQWMNGQYLKKLSLEQFALAARPFFEKEGMGLSDKKPDWFESVCEAVRGEVSLLSECPKAATLFFQAEPVLSTEATAFLKDPASAPIVNLFESELVKLPEEIPAEAVDALIKSVSNLCGTKGKSLYMPIRAALTGQTHGPELKRILPLFGRTKALKWIETLKAKAQA